MLIRRDDPWAKHLAAIVASYFPGPLESITSTRGAHDQDSDAQRLIYASLGPTFYQAYDTFVRRVVQTLTTQEWVVQAIPTFRVQCPGQTGTKEFHVDREYGHPPQSINVVVPCTRMADSTAILVEETPYTGTMTPMPAMQAGDYAIFDGANRRHGTVTNRTTMTRVSFDFRLLPRQYVPPAGTTTQTQRMPLALGAYYRELA
jgi:ectoine hydroxylase-related dioxygenase (phytanoyl-CoA dioxygenase family)